MQVSLQNWNMQRSVLDLSELRHVQCNIKTSTRAFKANRNLKTQMQIDQIKMDSAMLRDLCMM